MVKSVDPMSYLSIGFFLPALFLLILRPQSVYKIKDVLQFANFKKVLLLTFFYSVGSITFFYAILHGAQVSQLGPISNSSVILTVLLGTLFLGERDHIVKKIICTILVFIGVVLLR
jgi:uncharacterized membrane protein